MRYRDASPDHATGRESLEGDCRDGFSSAAQRADSGGRGMENSSECKKGTARRRMAARCVAEASIEPDTNVGRNDDSAGSVMLIRDFGNDACHYVECQLELRS